MENPGYKCYNCPLYSEFDTVIKHSIVTHPGNSLKYQDHSCCGDIPDCGMQQK